MFVIISAFLKDLPHNINQTRHTALYNRLQAIAKETGGLRPIQNLGCYKGSIEYSVTAWVDVDTALRLADDYEQESILVVDGRDATLVRVADGSSEVAGSFRSVSRERALQSDSFTWDARYDIYYVTE